jgi:type III pantothenate kinase|tara:strand:- start:624 stop:1361 length:738 start_codon:yes stop_codon:yes gene_type:complete
MRKMNLIIDIGNTATKLAVFQLDKIIKVQTVATKGMVFEVEKLLEKFSEIRQGLLSTVRTMDNSEVETLQKLLPIKILEASFKLPFENRYDTPLTLGVDRLALMAAAVKQCPNKNVLVIDAGSCITYDFMDADQNYLGGAISPGLEMRYKSLEAFTSNLPLLPKSIPNQRIGSSTEASIHSGVVHGVLQEIEGTIKVYQNKYPDLTVILTGGDADFLCKQFKISIFADSNFLLEGLNFLLEFNSN